jgi:hypothetical protein
MHLAPAVRLVMAESDHVCVRRPCLLCALERGEPLPSHTRLIDAVPRKILLWRERADPPEVQRLARRIAALSPPLREAVEQFLDEFIEQPE